MSIYKTQAYYRWKALKARGRYNIDPEWMDFTNYVRDVGQKPSDRHFLSRKDKTLPWGPENFEWKQTQLPGPLARKSKEYYRQWHLANPDYDRERRYKNKYGITLAQYEEMLKAQNGECYVCKLPESQAQQGTVRQLAVDHNHRTTAVRKLLDNKCNAILGHADDSIELLCDLVKYLAEHSDDPAAVIQAAIARLEGGI